MSIYLYLSHSRMHTSLFSTHPFIHVPKVLYGRPYPTITERAWVCLTDTGSWDLLQPGCATWLTTLYLEMGKTLVASAAISEFEAPMSPALGVQRSQLVVRWVLPTLPTFQMGFSNLSVSLTCLSCSSSDTPWGLRWAPESPHCPGRTSSSCSMPSRQHGTHRTNRRHSRVHCSLLSPWGQSPDLVSPAAALVSKQISSEKGETRSKTTVLIHTTSHLGQHSKWRIKNIETVR